MIVDVFANPEKENKKVFVKSRPGLAQAYTTAAGVARGAYYWVISGTGYIITVTGSKVYSNGSLLYTLTTTTGQVGFTEFVNSSGVVSLVMVDGTKGYTFVDAVTAPTEITDADFPTPHVPMPVFMDGYLFLAKLNTQDVYNSNLDDPTLWTAGDFLSAEMFPDTIVALTKNNNYIYAIGSNSLEYLYDAANATASPLARHDAAVQQFGTVAPASVVSTDKEVILVGETANGGHTVWSVDGFKEAEIGTVAIRSIFRAEGATLSSVVGHCIRVSGHKLYILTLTNFTLVYDFDVKMWSEWYSGATSGTSFIGSHAADGPNGQAYLLNSSTGVVYTISEDNHTDAGVAFVCQIVTPKYDYDSMNRKFMHRLSIIGDIPDSAGAGNTLQVQWTDDDYQTWSTSRDLSFDNDYPMITQLGSFRRRAFSFTYNQPYLLRLEGFEVDINKGAQ
jgi:translation initiation factor 1 (eIF-1/SUI1)